jgi:hypothetical protein
MERSVWVCTLLLGTAAALSAQQMNSSNPYQGTSEPPPDSTISVPNPDPPQVTPPAKPSPAHRMMSAPATQSVAQAAPAAAAQNDNADDGIVMIAPDTAQAPGLNKRPQFSDPDGDIVHPAPLPPGELGYGTTIRTRLLERVSTAFNESGDTFRTRVASDVIHEGKVLIPAGSEIDGTVAHISTGHFAGHGSMVLRPETVILPDGSRYRMYAQVAGTPGASTHVNNEGQISPGARIKKGSIEYGGGVGVGAVTGAALGGPVGALAGSLVGAGAVTVHLMMDHAQATLDRGTVLVFSLTQPLNLAPEASTASE